MRVVFPSFSRVVLEGFATQQVRVRLQELGQLTLVLHLSPSPLACVPSPCAPSSTPAASSTPAEMITMAARPPSPVLIFVSS